MVYVTALSDFISNHQIPKICGGTHEHNQTYWREFFANLEPLQNQCLAAGRRLVSVMGDIRSSDNQGIPSRRQLYSQHRALSRALMDPELQNLRRKGHTNLTKLKEIARYLSGQNVESNFKNATVDKQSDPVSTRLCEVITIFDEVDRAAKRLEQLTEQRRERLRELTRQRALEDEINEVMYSIFVFFMHGTISKFYKFHKLFSNLNDEETVSFEKLLRFSVYLRKAFTKSSAKIKSLNHKIYRFL